MVDLVDISVGNLGTGMAIHLAAYNESGTRLFYINDAMEGADVSYPIASRGGRYYVLVASDEANYRKRGGPYSLNIRARNANDAFEPNDSFDSATVVSSFPDTVHATVVVDAANDNNGDYEFFTFTVRAGRRVTFVLDPVAANTEMHFDVYNANRTRLGGLDGSDGQTLNYYLNNTGATDATAYVRVGAFVGDNGDYVLTFDETAVP